MIFDQVQIVFAHLAYFQSQLIEILFTYHSNPLVLNEVSAIDFFSSHFALNYRRTQSQKIAKGFFDCIYLKFSEIWYLPACCLVILA
ncbi:hypothetical protein FGO68_gene12259 [Halteria grandinella]|uniref:Uncharacterized protein n=1 Tax=Halteria grandinella TaxID=5974 RepID=A0A8J8NUE5_HALGN|nr:hypothetical protein FGO68_gene12259 [Halteria grandinella]